MYKRLIILTVIIAVALGGMTFLGYHAIERWSEALRWRQFSEAAELIKQDVMRKLDRFMEAEETRPYYHYQFYYMSEDATANQEGILPRRSPLAGNMNNSYAYGHFQIDGGGNILTPNDDLLEIEGANFRNTTTHVQNQLNRQNIKANLQPVLGSVPVDSKEIEPIGKREILQLKEGEQLKEQAPTKTQTGISKGQKGATTSRRGGRSYPIDLQRGKRGTQVVEQDAFVFQTNNLFNASGGIRQIQNSDGQQVAQAPAEVQSGPLSQAETEAAYGARSDTDEAKDVEEIAPDEHEEMNKYAVDAVTGQQMDAVRGAPDHQRVAQLFNDALQASLSKATQAGQRQGGKVKVEIGPFVPVVVGGQDAKKSVFDGQVFLMRHVQIDGQSFRQGFVLDQEKLLEEVKESADLFTRDRGMGFELPQAKGGQVDDEDVAWEAVLDFGFGHLVVYLKETVPEVIVHQANQLRSWYFSIVVVVLVAVMLGLLSLWRYARAQIMLAEKKDDFISSVSHELRTPLTSIRMYSEMLEKNWIKSEEKLGEYYKNMRQESERLSRLIENVLDFSRIQKGRKKYSFSVGNVNESIASVVDMMTPYAQQHGFAVRAQWGELDQMAFDNDAVKQIVVNLLDNAIKYARDAEDKTITIRTKKDTEFVLIEVEDHGPGVPHRQRKKIFEEFYRLGSEATRETTGTGLGLALVKKFAQAHDGFVEILSAKPAGSIFRVGLAVQS